MFRFILCNGVKTKTVIKLYETPTNYFYYDFNLKITLFSHCNHDIQVILNIITKEM